MTLRFFLVCAHFQEQAFSSRAKTLTESCDIVPMFESRDPFAAPLGVPNSNDRWNVVSIVARYMHAVCRIPGRGTAVLVSRHGSRGVLLTTSAALGSRGDAQGKEAVFFETTTLGAPNHKGIPKRPVKVALRPEKFFFTSLQASAGGPAGPPSYSPNGSPGGGLSAAAADAAILGYALVACDLTESKADAAIAGAAQPADLHGVVPLSLPVLHERVPPVMEGDAHLMVTFPEGQKPRRYFSHPVACVFESHCVYATVDLCTSVASGGPVFDTQGEWVAIQHLSSASCSYGILIRDIVGHMIDSLVLGQVRTLLLDSDPEDAHEGELHHEHDGSKTGTAQRLEVEGPYATCHGQMLAVYSDVEREEERRKAPVRHTMVLPTHQEVWEAMYRPSDYHSLVILLHSFPYHTKLLKKIIGQLTAPEHRADMPSLSRLGGIGMLMEAVELHPYDEELITAGVACLARLSLHEENRDAIGKYTGVMLLLSLMREYRNTPQVSQWACYCLSNLCVKETNRELENKQTFTEHSGLKLVIQALKDNGAYNVHLRRWACMLLGHVIGDNPIAFRASIEADHNLLTVAFDLARVAVFGLDYLNSARMKPFVTTLRLRPSSLPQRVSAKGPPSVGASDTLYPSTPAPVAEPPSVRAPQPERVQRWDTGRTADPSQAPADPSPGCYPSREDTLRAPRGGGPDDAEALLSAAGVADAYSLHGVLALLAALIKHDAYDAAAFYFAKCGLATMMLDAVRHYVTAHTGAAGGRKDVVVSDDRRTDMDESLLEALLSVMLRIAEHQPWILAEYAARDMEKWLGHCAMEFVSNATLHELVAQLLVLQYGRRRDGESAEPVDLLAICPHMQVQVAARFSTTTRLRAAAT